MLEGRSECPFTTNWQIYRYKCFSPPKTVTLKMEIAMFSERVGNLQHSIWLILKAKVTHKLKLLKPQDKNV